MDIDQYQTKLIELWGTPPDCDHLLFCAVGMAEEAGEALGKVKRLMRGEEFDRDGYLLELGDCLAYLTMAAHEKGLTLDFYECIEDEDRDLLNATAFLNTNCALFLDILLESLKPHSFEKKVIKSYLKDAATSLLACIEQINSSLGEVTQLNITKLEDRIARLGTLRGSGDKR